MCISVISSFELTPNPHALSTAQKVLHFMPNPNVVSYNTLLSGYFNSGLVTEAMEAFSAAPSKDCHSWNIAISGLVKNQRIEEAMTLFLKMRYVCNVRPDNYTSL
ncbi:hypothetical protein L6164_031265 [Bauhinia variegata]|uniref:Uncharacterized protein n=1 Tax=Bauhinia variegata TaxID=167791 RepID=A0ACB9LEY5_BAUVA|nr:hypothetical protein L6164_031265 [Bauhinia variegata]